MKVSLLSYILLLSLALHSSTCHAFSCKECDHLVESNVVDGKAMNVRPGQVICLVGGKVYDRLTFKNIRGSSDLPVTIRNCGGTAVIYSRQAFGVKFQHSKNIVFTGKGSSGEFGIKVTTEKGFYLTMESFTSDFDISYIEIAGPEDPMVSNGFAGIGAKTSPYEDCGLFKDPTRKAWVMENVSIHDNYIHDVGGEGLYLGHGFYAGREEKRCPGSGKLFAHSIRNIRIYSNKIENTGYDGIQIKNADENVLVHHNVIRNYGTKDHPAHNEGIFIGEGSTGEYYGNIVDTGSGNACQIQGIGNIDFHDNLLLNAGEHGIYASSGKFVVRWSDGYFNIHNNTIFNTQDVGLVFYNDGGGKKIISQNLVFSRLPYKEGSEVILFENSFMPTTEMEKPKLQAGQQGINISDIVLMMDKYLSEH